MHTDEPIAGSSSAQAKSGRNPPKKGKGRAEEAEHGDMEEGSVDREEDELHDSSDEDGKPRFNVGSSGPSRSGSAGGTRAPRTKIEVACDFCRSKS